MAGESKRRSKCLVHYNPNKLLQDRMASEILEGKRQALALEGSTEQNSRGKAKEPPEKMAFEVGSSDNFA